MKVDTGHCTSCNAKNSKFVEKCYKCGAVLPWGNGYVAPAAPSPQAVIPQGGMAQPQSPSQPAWPAVPQAQPQPMTPQQAQPQYPPQNYPPPGWPQNQPPYPYPEQMPPNAPPYYPPQQNINVVVNQKNGGSGWLVAWLLLLFGTPLGCIAIPIALVMLAVCFQFAPIIIAIIVAVSIGKSTLDPENKTTGIIAAIVIGAALNGLLLLQLRH